MSKTPWSKSSIVSWAKSNQRPAALLLAFAVVGSVMILRSFAAEDVVSYDSTKPVIPQLQRINSTVKRHTTSYKSSHPDRKRKGSSDPEQDKLVSDIKTRKKAMLMAIKSHPDEAQALAMPADVKAQLPDDLQKEVETTTELTGTWATGHSHAADGKEVGQLRNIVTTDGKFHEVYGAFMPNLEPGRDIRIKGLQIDNNIGLANSNSFYARTEKQTVKGASTTTPNVLADTTTYTLCKRGATPNCTPAAANNGNLDDNPIAPATDANYSNRFLIVGVKPVGAPFTADYTGVVPNRPVTLDDIKTALGGSSITSLRGFMAANSFGALNPVFDIYTNPMTGSQWSAPPVATASRDCITRAEADSAVDALVTNGLLNVAGYKGVLIYIDQIPCRGEGTSSTVVGAKGVVSRSYFSLQDADSFAKDVSDQNIQLNAWHEVGHALGLNHAHGSCQVHGTECVKNSDLAEYANEYSVMGDAFALQSNHYTAFEKYQLGWAAAGGGIGEATEARGSASYSFGKLETKTLGKNFGLRIPLHRDSNNKVDRALYLEYRPAGADAIDNFINDANIYHHELPFTSGLLINEVNGAPTHDFYKEYGPFPATEELLNTAGASVGDKRAAQAALAAGQIYRFHQPEAADARDDICIKFASGDGTIASVTVDRGCGATVTNKADPIPPNSTLSNWGTLGNVDSQGNPFPANFKNDTPLKDSSAVCLDDVAHRLFVADTHRIVEYDLDPKTNNLMDGVADHVLGAEAIGYGSSTDQPMSGIGTNPAQEPVGRPSENYLVRWTGKVKVPVNGSYTFKTISDDGVRIWVGGVQRINNWTDHPPTANTTSAITLSAGTPTDIIVEYYNHTGPSTIQLRWTGPSGSGIVDQIVPASAFGSGLNGQYFDGIGYDGTQKTRTDAQINNPWGTNIVQGTFPPFADAPGNPVGQNTINWANSRITCDPKNNRLFVANNDTSYGTSRILIFDFKGGLTNGMNASYVLGQKDFTSSDSKYSTKKADFYQANNFSQVGSMAYSAKRNMLFVANQSEVRRVLVFDLSKVTNNMNASYVFGQATGVFTQAASSPTALFGGPGNLAIDDTKDLLYVNSYYYGNKLYAQNIDAAMLDGKSYVAGTNIPLPTPISGVVSGPLALEPSGDFLYYMAVPSSGSTSVAATMITLDVRAPSAKQPVSQVAVSNFDNNGQVGANAKVGASTSIAIDSTNNFLYVPYRGGGRVLVYKFLGTKVTYHDVVTPPNPDPYATALTAR